MRAIYVGLESLLEDERNQTSGFTYIFDGSVVTFSHFAIFTASQASNAVKCSDVSWRLELSLLLLRHHVFMLFIFCYGIPMELLWNFLFSYAYLNTKILILVLFGLN